MAVELVRLIPFRGLGKIIAYGRYDRFSHWHDGTRQRTGLGWIDFSLPAQRVPFGGWWFDSERVIEPYRKSHLLSTKIDVVWWIMERLGLPLPDRLVRDPLEEGYAESREEALRLLAEHIAAETRREAFRIVDDLMARAERVR